MKITVAEEVIGRGIVDAIELDFSVDEITIKDIIAAKTAAVITKVKDENSSIGANHHFKSEEEQRLNRDVLNKKNETARKKIAAMDLDIEKETYLAFDAFNSNMFFILVDEKQYLDLDDKVVITKNSQIKFIRLTQLKGG